MQKIIRYAALVIALSVYYSTAYFDSISEMVAYAAKIPADTPNQSVDPYHTQYTKFHRMIPTLTETSFLSKIGFRKNVLINEFTRLLKSVTAHRELEGLFGDFVQKFYIEDVTKWYIWGALHGAFHSLVRGLNELKKYKMINDELLLAADVYLVFNGNMINYGTYQIETLLVILKLVEKNPSRVLLLKGAFEQEGAWQKTNFPDELRTRFNMSSKEIPLEKEISTFFNTLALANYLVSTEGDVVRISFYDHHPLLQENYWGNFLKKKSSEVLKIKYISKVPNEQGIKAQITSHAVKEIPYTIQGITYGKNEDVNSWVLFSAPLNMFRAYFNFYEDVSIQLTTGRYFSSWLITLFNQNPDNPTGFMRTREFEIATGKEIFTADPDKHIENLSEKIELAEIEKKHLQESCRIKQKESKKMLKKT